MLVWSRSGRWGAWGIAALLLAVFYLLPLAVIALASLAGQWNGALPSHLTFRHYADALQADSGAQLRVSALHGADGEPAGAGLRKLGGPRAPPPRAGLPPAAGCAVLPAQRGAFGLRRPSVCWSPSAARRCCSTA